MNTFRLQLRFLVPLLLTLGVAAYLALPLVDRLTLRWFSRDLNMRGELVTNALSDSIVDAVKDPEGARLKALFDRAVRDERLVAIGLCTRDGKLLLRTDNFPEALELQGGAGHREGPAPVIQIPGGPVQVSVHEVVGDAGPVAELVLLHDFSFIEKRSQDTRRYLVLLIAGARRVIALITVIVAQLSWRGWVSGARALLRGEGLIRPMAASRRAGAARHRPARAPARPRGRVPPLARARGAVERRAPALAVAHAAARRRGHRRVEPGALHPRARGRRQRRRAPARRAGW